MDPCRRIFLGQITAVLAVMYAPGDCLAEKHEYQLTNTNEYRFLRSVIVQTEIENERLRKIIHAYKQQLRNETVAGQLSLFRKLHASDLTGRNTLEVGGLILTAAEFAVLSIWAN